MIKRFWITDDAKIYSGVYIRERTPKFVEEFINPPTFTFKYDKPIEYFKIKISLKETK